MWGYILVILAAILIMKLLDRKTTNNYRSKEPKEKTITEFKGHYQAKNLLTRNEWHEYKKLKVFANAYGLQVCPKVRLLDIVEPRSGDPHYMAYLGKVKSKHVDFIICDADLHIKGILELDDNSHNRADRQERDQFVDEILKDVGYTVIHTRSITGATLAPITAGRTMQIPTINIDLRSEDEKEPSQQTHTEQTKPTYEEWKAAREKQINSEHPEQ